MRIFSWRIYQKDFRCFPAFLCFPAKQISLAQMGNSITRKWWPKVHFGNWFYFPSAYALPADPSMTSCCESTKSIWVIWCIYRWCMFLILIIGCQSYWMRPFNSKRKFQQTTYYYDLVSRLLSGLTHFRLTTVPNWVMFKVGVSLVRRWCVGGA